MAPFATPITLADNKDPDRATISTCLPASSPYLVPIPAYLSANPSVTNLMGSAAVFFTPSSSSASTVTKHTTLPPPNPSSPETKLLLIQRAPTDFLPLKWELPGGSVEPEIDSSVVAGAVRELEEETGLWASRVVRSLGTREFGETVPGSRNLLWRMCIFEVEVEQQVSVAAAADATAAAVAAGGLLEGDSSSGGSPTVRLDPAEHVAHRWVSEDEVREARCGDVELDFTDLEWRGILLRAFQLHRTGAALDEK